MENKLWFSEDEEYVWGYKDQFENEADFVKSVIEEHMEMTGYGCKVGTVEYDVFLMSDEPLDGVYCYRLRESKIKIETLYFAECSSLEYE